MAVDQAAFAAQLESSLAAVQAAVAAAGTISTASPFALAAVTQAVNAEIANLESAIAAYDADIITTSVAGVVAGPPAPTIWPILLNQVDDSVLLTRLINALGYLQRLSTNLAQATG